MEIDNQRLIRECRGTLDKGVLKWHGKDEKLIKGPKVGMEYTGRVIGSSIDLRFAGFDETVKKQAEGFALLQLEQPASKTSKKPPPPSVVGTWRGTFEDGKTADFPFRADHTVTGTNGFQGRWIQSGRKVIVMQTTPSRAPKWEGEIEPDGKTMRLRNEMFGVASYVRQ